MPPEGVGQHRGAAAHPAEEGEVDAHTHLHRPHLSRLSSVSAVHQCKSKSVETAYKVAICPRVNLFYKQIYLIADLKLLRRGILGLQFIYFIGDFTL